MTQLFTHTQAGAATIIPDQISHVHVRMASSTSVRYIQIQRHTHILMHMPFLDTNTQMTLYTMHNNAQTCTSTKGITLEHALSKLPTSIYTNMLIRMQHSHDISLTCNICARIRMYEILPHIDTLINRFATWHTVHVHIHDPLQLPVTTLL